MRDINAKFDISYSPQSPEIAQSLGGGISNFWISGKSHIKESYLTPEPVIILTWNLDQ